MTEATWPTILAPRRVLAEVVASSLGAARNFTAIDDLADSGAEYWSIIFDEIPVATRAQKLALRVLSGQLNGRMGSCSVPIFDDAASPGIGVVSGAVAQGSNEMTIVRSIIVPGTHFTLIGDSGQDRLYRVANIVEQIDDITWSIRIWPLAREAYHDGTSANFAAPTCICKLASDSEMFTAGDDYGARTLAKIGWTEYK
jgi:hypothetical protein